MATSYYNRTVAMYNESRSALQKAVIDDAYLDIACIQTHQAFMFLLNCILTEHGVYYESSKNIRYLMNQLRGCDFHFEYWDIMEQYADLIYKWDEQYVSEESVTTDMNTVIEVHELFLNLNEAFIREQIEYQNLYKDKNNQLK